MEPLSEYSSLAAAHYKFLDLSNSEPDGDPVGLGRNRGIVAQGAGHVYIRCVEDIALVRLTVRFWPSRPPPEDGWQEAGEGRLTLTSGELEVTQWTLGGPDPWPSPFTGEVVLRIAHRGREETVRAVKRVYRRADSQDLPLDESLALIHEVDGTEHYLIDVFPAEQPE